jgi:PBP1b-binding outer membrane lipoprotein LpoB
MKSIISLLLCSLLLIGCATSQATEITQKPILTPPQETQQKVRPHGEAFLLPKNVICNDSKVMYDLLKSEPGPQVPVFSGLIRTSQGDVTMMAQIFIDKENRKFSIVESSTEGISCVISAGFDFDILPHSHPGEIQKGSGQEVNKGIHKLPQKIRMQN